MKRFYVGAVLASLGIAVWQCKGDPTSSLRNGPASLNVTPRQIYMDTGKTAALTVTARDEQLNPSPIAGVTVTPTNPAVAKVTVDSTKPYPDSSTYAFVVSGGSPGQTKLTITAAGLSDSSIVSVLPLVFNGALSTTTPKGGDTLTITSTAVLKFNPAKDTVTFGGGKVAPIVVNTANALEVLVPFSDAGAVTITHVVVTFIPNTELTLPTSASVHQTGDRWVNDSSWHTAPDITAALPASGTSVQLVSAPGPANKAVCPEFVLAFGSAGPCMMFKFTLADSTILNFTTDWEGGATNPDVDIYACSDSTLANFGTACFEDGGAGATSAKPQSTGNHKYPAGTHYFVIENFAGAASRNLYTTISRP
jgi:hypothetical protein